MKKNNILTVIMIILPLLVGLLSFLLTRSNMNLYSYITKPPLAPPSWLFSIAWSILYLLMGIAATIIFRSNTDSSMRKMGLILHIIQLVLNFAWSIFFFNMKAYLFSFVWLVLLWITVFFMIVKFKEVSLSAFILNIPYLVWLTFAGYLNLAIYILN